MVETMLREAEASFATNAAKLVDGSSNNITRLMLSLMN